MYSCGPTVYNNAHIGNIFSIVTANTLYRWLKFGEKYNVQWVMNITDVDDKTIKKSQKSNNKDKKQALKETCRYYEDKFFNDIEKLNIKKTDFYKNPRATEYITEQQDLIKKIIKNG